ncbi:TM1802 family CRISPR-associated protein [Roseivirga sp. BDSF3-8]|uniref:TM1802 family CRISPR-associated protein n=1 Tax=Roseivirga sp. BDSF3-8 TaxID=3241598 RepID=UPI003531B254
MLHTLYTLGKELSEGLDSWDDFLDLKPPRKDPKKKTRDLVLPIVFRLGENKIEKGEVSAYDPERTPRREGLRRLIIRKRNAKAIYPTVDAEKPDLLYKTLFGKPKDGVRPDKGHLYLEAEGIMDGFEETLLGKVLLEIVHLHEEFKQHFNDEDKGTISSRKIQEWAGIEGNDRAIVLVAEVLWPDMGIDEPTPLVLLPGFEEFFEGLFFHTAEGRKGLDYSIGEIRENVSVAEFGSKYNMNKMFVRTTYNHAQNLRKQNLYRNYQLSPESVTFLERGSNYLFENYKVRIAGLFHVIIPQIRHKSNVKLKAALSQLKTDVDLIFQEKQVRADSTYLGKMAKDITWVTFLAYDLSHGKSFKTINMIQEVSQPYLTTINKLLVEVNNLMAETPGTGWKYLNNSFFNLTSVYHLIPVRDEEKEKVNRALVLFKNILEHRLIDRNQLYSYYTELLLCHRYGRHNSYKNIYAHNELDYALHEATMKYHALLLLLDRLYPIPTMETDNTIEKEPEEKDYYQRIDTFMERVGYEQSAQRALFFLGIALKKVADKQKEKGYSKKPVLNKVNFNGMDRSQIIRLHNDLREKVQQYSIHKSTEGLLSRFQQHFQAREEDWRLSPQETIFYLFAGYSYFDKKQKETEETPSE